MLDGELAIEESPLLRRWRRVSAAKEPTLAA
jgi:hypothetical protein